MNVHACSLAIALTLAGAAHADALEQFRRGNLVHFDTFRFDVEGTPIGSSDFNVAKPSGAIDLVVPLSALGPEHPQLIHLRADLPVGNRITWTFYEDLVPGLPIPGQVVVLDHIEGQVVVDLAEIPFETRTVDGLPRAFSVSVVGQASTSILLRATGDNWRTATDVVLVGRAGFGPTNLVRTRVSRPMNFCLHTGRQFVTIEARLNQVAPVPVPLTVDGNRVVHVVGIAPVVPVGQQTLNIPLFLETHTEVSGAITVSGGGTSTPPIDYAVHSCGHEAAELIFIPQEMDWSACHACVFRTINAWGDVIGTDDGEPVRSQGGLEHLGQLLGDGASIESLDAFGRIAGSIAPNATTVGYTLGDDVGAKVVQLAGFMPIAANDMGALVGFNTDDWTAASLVDGVRSPLPTLGGSWTQPVDVNGFGAVAGTSATIDGAEHAFVYADGVMTDLGDLGGGTSIAAAVSEAGAVAGTSRTAEGAWHAFVWSAENGTTDVGAEKGLASVAESWAIDVNAQGYVLGVASDPQGVTTPFLYVPGVGLVDLREATAGDATIDEAIALNDANQILVRGTINGQSASFMLAPLFGEVAQ